MSHQHAAMITPSLIEWAMDRADKTIDDVAAAASTSKDVVEQWMTGSKSPSFRQAKALASALRTPFAILFLDSPPREALPIPDLRTINGQAVGHISVDLRDVILSTLRKKDWLSEHRKESGVARVAVVGKGKGSTSPTAVAPEIRRWLGLLAPSQRGSGPDYLLRELIKVIDGHGISVLRSGIVGNNTRRTLSIDEFRGFAISDEFAPFIFINSVDSKPAQIFTLIHELTHIWMGDSGISGGFAGTDGNPEAFCNQVAAEVLVPALEFQDVWDTEVPVSDAIERCTRRFHMSRYVIAIRAYESGFISQGQLTQLLNHYRSSAVRTRRSDGGDFYKTLFAKNGISLTKSVVDAVGRQRVLVRDAAFLLDAKPSQLGRIAQELKNG